MLSCYCQFGVCVLLASFVEHINIECVRKQIRMTHCAKQISQYCAGSDAEN
jgi:hypothetical protein